MFLIVVMKKTIHMYGWIGVEHIRNSTANYEEWDDAFDVVIDRINISSNKSSQNIERLYVLTKNDASYDDSLLWNQAEVQARASDDP